MARRLFVVALLWFCAMSLGTGRSSVAGQGPAPIPPNLGMCLDGEQGFSPHRLHGITPYLFNLKLGPVLYIPAWQFQAYAGMRYAGEVSRLGGGLAVSRFLWEPGSRGVGLRLVLDGSLYSGGQALGAGGFILDLDKLVRAGVTVGVGNRPNDHLILMTTLGTDLVQIGKILWPVKRPY